MPKQGTRKGNRRKGQKEKIEMKPHISIVKNVDEIMANLPKKDKKYGCPLCPDDKFKPAWPSKVKKHLKSHDHGIYLKELNKTVLACHLECRDKKKDRHAHYHCVCGRTVARKDGFHVHWEQCLEQLSFKSEIPDDSGLETSDDLLIFLTDISDGFLILGSDMFEDMESESIQTDDANEFVLPLLSSKQELSLPTEETCKPDISHLEVIPHPVEESASDFQGDHNVSLINGKSVHMQFSQEQAHTSHPVQVHPTHCEQADQFEKNKFQTSFSDRIELPNQLKLSENYPFNDEKVESGMALEMMSELIDPDDFYLSKLENYSFQPLKCQDLQDSGLSSFLDDEPILHDIKKEPPDHSTFNNGDYGGKFDVTSYISTDLSQLDSYLHTTKLVDDFYKLNTSGDQDEGVHMETLPADTYYEFDKLGALLDPVNDVGTGPMPMDVC